MREAFWKKEWKIVGEVLVMTLVKIAMQPACQSSLSTHINIGFVLGICFRVAGRSSQWRAGMQKLPEQL